MTLTTVKRLNALASELGLEPSPRRGFHGFKHPDTGARLDIFSWSNPAHAATAGLPSAFLVLAFGTSQDGGTILEHASRVRIALVDQDGAHRRWPDVHEEIVELAAPILALPPHEVAAAIRQLDPNRLVS